jgi:hypothetical protein
MAASIAAFAYWYGKRRRRWWSCGFQSNLVGLLGFKNEFYDTML